jgi:hypothetical protein
VETGERIASGRLLCEPVVRADRLSDPSPKSTAACPIATDHSRTAAANPNGASEGDVLGRASDADRVVELLGIRRPFGMLHPINQEHPALGRAGALAIGANGIALENGIDGSFAPSPPL